MPAKDRSHERDKWRIGEWHAGPDQRCQSRVLQLLTILLALTAAGNVLLAEADGPWPSALAMVLFALQCVAVFWGAQLVEHAGLRRGDASGAAPTLIIVVVLSLGWYGAMALWSPANRTLEVLALLGLRNLLLTVALFSTWMRYQRLAVLLSFFVTLFSATISQSAPLVPGMVAFASLGAVWLYLAHWHDLRGQRLDSVLPVSRSRQFLIPAGWVLLVAGMLVFGRASTVGSLRGLLPSSGGDRWQHAAAKGGVFDGDALVAGTENIQSFAPIDDAPFLPDHQPSLYDVFNDTFDEPVVAKKTARSIPLPPELGAEIERRMAVSQQASRQFATLRQSRQADRRRVKNIESPALLYLAGETPLHLRLETYDLFDGIHWYGEPSGDHERIEMRFETIHQRPWLVLPNRLQTLPVFRGTRTHAVKLIHLRTDRVPSPLHVVGVHVDLLDQSPMFHGRYGGFVHIDRESIPSLVPIHFVWDVLDFRRIARHIRSIPSFRPEFVVVPDHPGMARTGDLAQEWTAGIPRGWRQIERVIERLRNHCEHDREARAPKDSEFPLEHFLFEARRGPDYQFATAAALMLRALDYPTRVVSGFYASPARYDVRLQHTPVLTEDAHFWTEVYLGAGVWVPLEPTPGYELLEPPATWLDRVYALIGSLGQFLLRNWPMGLLAFALGTLVFLVRYPILDRLQVGMWKVWPHRNRRRRVLSAFHILERRGRWVGLPRAPGVTPRRWLERAEQQVENFELAHFLVLADWAAFSPANTPDPPGDLTEICMSTLRHYSLPRLRSTSQSRGRPSPNNYLSPLSDDLTERCIHASEFRSKYRRAGTGFGA
jgi:protein-glutamine gamma-glutamyltransferase